MNYITTAEAAEKWNISANRVFRLIAAGRIPGAIKPGNSWLIPENAPKPADGRTKQAKKSQKTDDFRFPLYMNFRESSFTPPLNDEEKALRQAQLDFLACDFAKSETELEYLSNNAECIYLRQMSLFYLCLLSANTKSGMNFEFYSTRLELSLTEDFPRKKEMGLLKPWLLSCVALYKKAAEQFYIDDDYEYSPSVHPIMACLSFANIESIENPETIDVRADIYKLEAKQLEREGYFFEAQTINISLFLAYFMKHNVKLAMIYLKKAINIAFDHDFVFPVAEAYPYYDFLFDRALEDYPQEFADRVKEYGNSIGKSFATFAGKMEANNMCFQLPTNEVKYIFYAVQGFSNKRVAKILHLSERTVGKHYAEIYEKLGVDGKQGLLDSIKESYLKKENTEEITAQEKTLLPPPEAEANE